MFNWDDYFELAENLLKQSASLADGEAYSRAAISRAYYAVYHRVAKFAEKNDNILLEEIEKESVANFRHGGKRLRSRHEAVAEFLNRFHAPFYEKEYLRLDRLHKARIICDYHDNCNVRKLNVNLLMENAKNILSQIP